MSDTRISFKDMCARFDVTPRTLRYYEYIELLEPEREGRARYYRQRDVARMKLILRGRRWGFSLEDIRKWLMIYDKQGDEAQMREWIKLADTQLDVLRGELQTMQKAIDELQENRDAIAKSLT
ncbi:MerR family transcriptional regulator [Maribius pontilimi]|uniref:MerR family transcriptional regulator n=1 Tax=Palleronia pontilimi TaxID=1964209 RepID=A0A934I8W4_9RHOB|nr:MerR family transcriptional regulator [Palleronia pontilimi]MBJ3762624.1 MerR family transcriptional regulator [Palleronia pontilimi]